MTAAVRPSGGLAKCTAAPPTPFAAAAAETAKEGKREHEIGF